MKAYTNSYLPLDQQAVELGADVGARDAPQQRQVQRVQAADLQRRVVWPPSGWPHHRRRGQLPRTWKTSSVLPYRLDHLWRELLIQPQPHPMGKSVLSSHGLFLSVLAQLQLPNFNPHCNMGCHLARTVTPLLSASLVIEQIFLQHQIQDIGDGEESTSDRCRTARPTLVFTMIKGSCADRRKSRTASLPAI